MRILIAITADQILLLMTQFRKRDFVHVDCRDYVAREHRFYFYSSLQQLISLWLCKTQGFVVVAATKILLPLTQFRKIFAVIAVEENI